MPRFVIDCGATLHLASSAANVSPEHELVAPTLWRSETLAALYPAVRKGELGADVARERIAYVNGLKIRLLGDAVLRRRAWEVALELEMQTTYGAEYIALAQLQKGTLVSTDEWLPVPERRRRPLNLNGFSLVGSGGRPSKPPGAPRPARLYDLRSTFASNALARGITAYKLARIMGTSVGMVEAHYGALLDTAHDSVLDRLEGHMSQEPEWRGCRPAAPLWRFPPREI